MNKKKAVLGIDTSNYTTSIGIIDIDGNLVANFKKPLPVKEGERGLRQSDALFAHTVNFPEIMRDVSEYMSRYEIVAVGVSATPRRQEGSYMPCFLSGVSVAESICAVNSLPLYRFSHQCGHIMAAVYSSGSYELLNRSFGAFHISGGTTELVRVTPVDSGFSACLLGGTADLNAGQVIDRVGVYMGLKFPCGAEMEIEAFKNDKKIPKKNISIKGMEVNLSGLENMAIKLYRDTDDIALTCAFVFDYIGRCVSALIDRYYELYGEEKMILAGGVMSNSIIKKMLSDKYDVSFAQPAMSADNAVGIAALTLRAYSENNK